MVAWSLAYVWPRGAPWEGKPREYATLLVEFVRRQRKTPDTRFVIAVHESLSNDLVQKFSDAAKDAAKDAPVRIVRCSGDPFLPTAQRIVPLLDPMDFTDGHEVVLADVHDGYGTQDTLLKKLQGARTQAGFTCWPAVSSGNVATHQCSLQARLPFDSAKPNDYHWHLDAGLATTSTPFRKALFAKCKGFQQYLNRFVVERCFERSVDEVAMEAYLSNEKSVALLRKHAVFHVHTSWPRTPRSRDPLKGVHLSPPVYRGKCQPIAIEPEEEHKNVREKRWLQLAVHRPHLPRAPGARPLRNRSAM